MLSGSGNADITSYRRTLLGREGDASFLFRNTTILAREVLTLLTVNAHVAADEWFVMADLLRYLVADSLRDFDADRINTKRSGYNGKRSGYYGKGGHRQTNDGCQRSQGWSDKSLLQDTIRI